MIAFISASKMPHLVHVGVVELNEEMALGDTKKRMDLIDELIPLRLVLHSHDLHGQGNTFK